MDGSKVNQRNIVLIIGTIVEATLYLKCVQLMSQKTVLECLRERLILP